MKFKSACFLLFIFIFCQIAGAEDKTWSGGGDGTSWSDEGNWLPEGVPTASSDVIISRNGAVVVCDRTSAAKTLTLGGLDGSRLMFNSFVYGNFSPSFASDIAVLNRKNGLLTLKGPAGTITLKGQYVSSQASITPEPSLLFWVE